MNVRINISNFKTNLQPASHLRLNNQALWQKLAKALVHIGLEKTGTTAIQEFLQINKQLLLEEHRIWVADYLGKGSQWLLAALAYDNQRDDDLTHTLGSPVSRQSKLDETRRKITYSVKHQPAELFCFSSEHLSSRLTTVAELQTLQHFLKELFEEIKIVIYVREPIRMAISRQSTIIKMGIGSCQLPPPEQNAGALDFRTIIQRWEATFPDAVCVRLFDETSETFDLIEDFSSLLKLSQDRTPLRPPNRANPSLKWDEMRLFSAINLAAHKHLGGPLPPAVLQQITSILEANSTKSSSYHPTKEEQNAYKHYYSEQTDWLFETYFPERIHQWSTSDSINKSQQDIQRMPLSLTPTEAALCSLLVQLTDSNTLPWEEIAEHLAQLAWKISRNEALNQHDQETSERLCTLIRSKARRTNSLKTPQPKDGSISGAA